MTDTRRPPAAASRLARLGGWALAALLVPSLALAARGRDAGTGYEWIDNADGATPGPGVFMSFTRITPADDAPPTMVTLPFMFPFYDGATDRIWISDNGWIGLDAPTGAHPTPTTLPDPSAPARIIAPFWTDLQVNIVGRYIDHGPSTMGTYRIQYAARIAATGGSVLMDVYLYPDGRIKFQNLIVTNYAGVTVGIEDRSGTEGFSVVDRGTPEAGVPAMPTAGYVIEILPPPILASECAMVPVHPCGTTMESMPGPFAQNILTYGCSATSHTAREVIYAIDVVEPTHVRARATPGTASDLRVFLLDFCSERSCVRGGTASVDVLLGAGRYYLVVDAPLASNEGTFTFDVTCTPMARPMACGDTVMGTTVGGSTHFTTYPCAVGRNLTGPEAMYILDVPTSTNLRASLTFASADLDVVIMEVATGRVITSADCRLHDGTSAVFWGAPPGRYMIVVDGFGGASGDFTLETACEVAMDCGAIAGVVDFTTGPRQSVSGNTVGAPADVDVYACNVSAVYGGGELVYELVLPVDGRIGIFEPGGASGLSFFVLSACNEGACVGSNLTCGGILPAGTHYLVVDGPVGSEGPFFAQLVYEQPFNRWSECQDPDGSTMLGDTVRTVWDFDDHDYCISDPNHRNYPDGCDFAMYVAARCGTELHIPLYDVESGSVRIYDVFREVYVDLMAESTGGWTSSGTHILWEDCPGTDGRWNNQTTDIWFERPLGLCGVYRIEFIDHAGFIWDLFSNCSGTNSAGFPIYDSLCGALAAYEPLADINMFAATAVLNCPEIEVTYTLENIGCAPGTNVVVTLLDNMMPVATDVVGLIEPGTQVTQTFTATFPGMSTSNVTVAVDVGNTVVECEERPGAGCLVTPGSNFLALDDCSIGCDVTGVAQSIPPRICAGESVTIDASGSTAVDCVGGFLEYQLSDPMGVVVPWQPIPQFTGVMPDVPTTYTVEVRCSAFPTVCLDAVPVLVDVVVSDPISLPAVGPSLRLGNPDDYSETTVPMRWTPDRAIAVGLGEHYHVLRSDRPDGGWVQLNVPDPPLLQVEAFVDGAADQVGPSPQVYYYLVFVGDECHVDNRALDVFTTMP